MITRKVGYGAESRVETVGVGCTFGTDHKEERVMSDVWRSVRHAYYLDREAGSVRDVWTDGADVTTDATDEARKEAVAIRAADAVEAERYDYDRVSDEIAERAAEVRRGDRITVVRGRKVPKGTAGEVFWLGNGRWGWRVGFTADGVENDGSNGTFTALSNVEVDADAVAARVAAVERNPFDAAAEARASARGAFGAERWLDGLTVTNDEVEAAA